MKQVKKFDCSNRREARYNFKAKNTRRFRNDPKRNLQEEKDFKKF